MIFDFGWLHLLDLLDSKELQAL